MRRLKIRLLAVIFMTVGCASPHAVHRVNENDPPIARLMTDEECERVVAGPDGSSTNRPNAYGE